MVCAILSMPEKRENWKYLGGHLWGRRLAIFDFQYSRQKAVSKVDSWSWTNPSFAGRMILLESVLASQLIYTIFAVRIPTTILREIEFDFRAFLWRYSLDRKGLHLMA